MDVVVGALEGPSAHTKPPVAAALAPLGNSARIECSTPLGIRHVVWGALVSLVGVARASQCGGQLLSLPVALPLPLRFPPPLRVLCSLQSSQRRPLVFQLRVLC